MAERVDPAVVPVAVLVPLQPQQQLHERVGRVLRAQQLEDYAVTLRLRVLDRAFRAGARAGGVGACGDEVLIWVQAPTIFPRTK